MELPKLTATMPDAAASMVPHYFTAPEFSALQKLGDILMPAVNGKPGASDAKAVEFLDFLIGESPFDRQQVYRTGLEQLNAHSQKAFHEAFGSLDAKQADTILAPLHQTWTTDTPTDPLERFLRVVKQDIRTATANSREYVTAARAGGTRRGFGGGGGLYWYPLD